MTYVPLAHAQAVYGHCFPNGHHFDVLVSTIDTHIPKQDIPPPRPTKFIARVIVYTERHSFAKYKVLMTTWKTTDLILALSEILDLLRAYLDETTREQHLQFYFGILRR